MFYSWIKYTDKSVEWKFQQILSLMNDVSLDETASVA